MKKIINHKIKWWWSTRVAGFLKIRTTGYLRQRANESRCLSFTKIAEPVPTDNSKGITVILTAYKRAEYLVDQINALKNQSIPPKEIWVWSNQSDKNLLDVSDKVDRVVVSNSNYSFWGRFSLATMVRTQYIALFDDDILPEPQWFENCLQTIASGVEGILGGSGVILPSSGGYSSKNKAGWNGLHSDHIEQVDLVGHSWFFDKQYLNYFWREEPVTWKNGEDIHFCYMALKYGGIKTYVPPHPENQHSLWSCRSDFGKVVGRLEVATYKNAGHKQGRSDIVERFRMDGWKTIKAK